MKWRMKLEHSTGAFDKLSSPWRDVRFFFDNSLYSDIIWWEISYKEYTKMKIETVDKKFEIGMKYKQVLRSIWWVYYKQISSGGSTSKLYSVAVLFDSRQGLRKFLSFSWFSSVRTDKSWTISSIMRRRLSFLSFPIHCLPVILHFEAV